MRSIWVVMLLAVAAASCSSDSSANSTSEPQAVVESTTTAVTSATSITAASVDVFNSGADDCNQTPVVWSVPEVQGIATNATIYGLLFPTHEGPVRAGDELKIVWRMTGEGDLSVRYFAPDGRERVLVFGPEYHEGSTYDRPGDEWGTGFLFDTPGCWHIQLQRSVGSGDVWLPVTPP